MSASEGFALAALIAAPVVILGVVGMVRGYHMHLKIWKHHEHEEDTHGND